MPSTKLVQILRSKGAPFTDDELERMPDRDAWAWIYTHDAANRRPKDARPEVCLTGFATDEKDGMAAIAEAAGFKVTSSGTKKLVYLVTGDTPGAAKIAQAEAQGAAVVSAKAFHEMCAGRQGGAPTAPVASSAAAPLETSLAASPAPPR